jgi:long-chain acyl-CoA synthetase
MNAAEFTRDSIQKYGEYVAFQYQDRAWTNREHDAYASRLATVLLEKGVQRGDRVPVIMPNCPEVLACFQAIWKIGAVIVPTTPQLSAREVGYVLDHSDAKLALTTPELGGKIQEAAHEAQKVEAIYTIGTSDNDQVEDIAPAIEGAEVLKGIADTADDDMAFLLYTSGTTGHPKGVMLSHRNIMTNHAAVAKFDRLIERSQTILTLPLSHSFGVLMMNLCSIFGCTATVLPRFGAEDLLKAVDQYKADRFSLVPTMLVRLLEQPNRGDYDTSSIDIVNSGGAILPNEVRVAFEQAFDCRVLDGYGLSECAPTATSYPAWETIRPGSIGKPIDGVTVSIQDEDGTELSPRAPGEICIQGPNVMAGYWKNPKATAEALRGGWLHSGDVGYKDEDGYVYLTDRMKDLIIKGGENISPREIEDAFYEHPAVAEAVCVGVPDATYGENIAAVVALKANVDASEEELLAHLREYVTKYKLPQRIVFLDELPKNPNGKIDRKRIRADLKERV